MLPLNDKDQTKGMLTDLVKQCEWQSVDKALQKGVSVEQHRWAIEEASQRADDLHFACYISQHCTKDHLDAVLTTLVTRGLWWSVGKLLQKGVSDEKHSWAVREASRRADDQNFKVHVLKHCSQDHLECCFLFPLVTRGLWQSVGAFLQRGVRVKNISWVVEKAGDTNFAFYILEHCSQDHLESVLTSLVTKRYWQSVDYVLRKGVSVEKHKFAVEEASQNAYDRDFACYISRHCAQDQLETVLTSLVTRAKWQSVGRVLGKGVRGEKLSWAVAEASQRASDGTFDQHILKHCSSDSLETVLNTLVTRGVWQSVDKVMQKGVSAEKHSMVVEKASKTCDDQIFMCYILKHCNNDHFESILTSLVTRGLWQSVDRVLQIGVSVEKHKWAIDEASREVNDSNFVYFVLRHCSQDHLETVLATLVRRGLWQSVDKVLQKGVSVEKHTRAIEEASRKMDDSNFKNFVLKHCSQEHLENVLTTLVQRGLWQSVDEVLQKGVSVEKHTWVIEEAGQTADEQSIMRHILKHCNKYHLKHVLGSLVTRSIWQPVGVVLQRDDSLIRQAVEKASKKAEGKDFETYILPHCNEDLLLSVLPNLERRGLLYDDAGRLHEVVEYQTRQVIFVYRLAKEADPLSLIWQGTSVLFCAVNNGMVKESIMYGLSTHQPSLTGQVTNERLIITINKRSGSHQGLQAQIRTSRLHCSPAPLKSPFLQAVMRHLPVTANILYESGACSYNELFLFYTLLTSSKDVKSEEQIEHTNCKSLMKTAESLTPSLKEMATTPRSLMSSCRLVISHCLKVSWRRKLHVQQLPLSDRMKNYIMFSDLTDPDSPAYLYKS